jgi:hypothetical protein
MKQVGLDEVPLHGSRSRCGLPLGFARETSSGPAREGIRLVEADVTYGLVGPDLSEPAETEDEPDPLGTRPVERRSPAALAGRGPTVREPELRLLVAARLDELEVLAIGDEPRGELEGVDVDAMARALVVESERVALVADPADPLVPAVPGGRLGLRGRSLGELPIDGRERISGEEVLDVGQDQLLVLLLVVQPELDQTAKLLRDPPLAQRSHAAIHVVPVLEDLAQSGSRDLAPIGARVLLAYGVVVRVEEHAELRAERPVPGHVGLEQERLEEPARVGEVPLGGTRLGHGLRRRVLRREWLTEALRCATHAPVGCRQVGHGDRSIGEAARARSTRYREKTGQ